MTYLGKEEPDPKAVARAMDMGISIVDPAPGLAARIHDNHQLRAFLLANKPNFRRTIYDAIVPHLKFKPSAYFQLITKRKAKKQKHDGCC